MKAVSPLAGKPAPPEMLVDVSKLERALTPRTRAIVAVSILGNPAALDVIERFAREQGTLEVDEKLLDAARDFFGM